MAPVGLERSATRDIFVLRPMIGLASGSVTGGLLAFARAPIQNRLAALSIDIERSHCTELGANTASGCWRASRTEGARLIVVLNAAP